MSEFTAVTCKRAGLAMPEFKPGDRVRATVDLTSWGEPVCGRGIVGFIHEVKRDNLLVRVYGGTWEFDEGELVPFGAHELEHID